MKYQINNGDSWSTISKEQYDKCCEIFDCRIVNDWDVPESPITTVAPAVSEEGEIEEIIKEAEKLFKGHRQSDKDGSSELHYIKAGALWEDLHSLLKRAGANSVRQQGDAVAVLNWLLTQSDLEKIVMIDGCFYWEEDTDGDQPLEPENIVKLYLKDSPQSPSVPQPGFIEKLRAANPYTDFSKYLFEISSRIWNECVDKASEILGEKGVERRLQRQEDNNEHLGKCLKMLELLWRSGLCGDRSQEVRALIMPRPQPKTSFEGLE